VDADGFIGTKKEGRGGRLTFLYSLKILPAFGWESSIATSAELPIFIEEKVGKGKGQENKA